MPHIPLPEGPPGILGPMKAYPETERHLNALTEVLLRGPSSLTSAERKIIAASVPGAERFGTQARPRRV